MRGLQWDLLGRHPGPLVVSHLDMKKKNTKACESRPDFDSELLDIKTSAEGASVVVVQSFSSSKVQILFQHVPFLVICYVII